MVRTLDRLVGWTFLKLFLVSILATPPLFMLGQVTEDLDTYVDKGLGAFAVLHAYLYKMPQWILWSFPVAGLIAVVFTVHGMTVNREVVAAKAGGVSFHRLVAPILVLAGLLTVVALGLSEAAPRSERVAARILDADNLNREWRTDFVYQTDDGLALSVRRLTVGDGRLTGVVVERVAGDTLPAMHIQAATATWMPTSGWTLHDGWLRFLQPDGREWAYTFRSMSLPEVRERPEELLQKPRDQQEMTYGEIDRLAKIIERSGGDAHDLLVKKEQKLAIPVATLVIILFGAPMATSAKRGGTAYGLGVALGATILYMLLMKIAGGLGASGTLPPLAAAWLPNLVFLVAGLVLMVRVRT